MKNFKKFTAAIAATLMAASLSIPMTASFTASAATITMQDGTETNTTSTFKAYKILDASISGDAYTYTVNDTYRNILKTALGLETNATDDAIISSMNDLTAETLRPVADTIYKAILSGSIAETATTTNGKFNDLAQGYYLIAETALGSNNTDGTMSLVMVDTMGEQNVEVKTKKEAPSFQKKVKDTNDSVADSTTDWQDSADYDIGDDVPFQLKATLPADYDKYSQYKLVFHDDLNKANAKDVFNKPTSVTVYVDKNQNGRFDEGESITTAVFSTTVSSDHADDFDCDFEVTIPDLKVVNGVTADMPVYVEYTAKLNDNAVLGSAGNWNDAYLEYSNNPYHTGEGDTTSKTVKDTNVVFTYKTIIDKVKTGETAGNYDALTGAKFKLEKKLANGNTKTIKEFTTGTESTFEFTGLDDGDYILTETEAPAGYKKIDEPIQFTISAVHTNDPETLELTSLTGNVTSGEINVINLDSDKNMESNLAAGTLNGKIINTSGSELPSTGGIGTTLFYIGGGCMVAVAGIFLITKKRMSKSAE